MSDSETSRENDGAKDESLPATPAPIDTTTTTNQPAAGKANSEKQVTKGKIDS